MKKLVAAVCVLIGLTGSVMAMEMPFTATITGQASGFISPGDVMNNGMVYVGTMDGSTPYFVNRCDYGFNWNPDTDSCDGTRGVLSYGAYGVSISATSLTDGAANTAVLAARSDTPAGKYCADLAPPDVNSHGYSDWYLPALSELQLVKTNYIAIGNFLTNYYWTSTAHTRTGNAYYVRFGSADSYNSRNSGYYIRCMRKGN